MLRPARSATKYRISGRNHVPSNAKNSSARAIAEASANRPGLHRNRNGRRMDGAIERSSRSKRCPILGAGRALLYQSMTRGGVGGRAVAAKDDWVRQARRLSCAAKTSDPLQSAVEHLRWV